MKYYVAQEYDLRDFFQMVNELFGERPGILQTLVLPGKERLTEDE